MNQGGTADYVDSSLAEMKYLSVRDFFVRKEKGT